MDANGKGQKGDELSHLLGSLTVYFYGFAFGKVPFWYDNVDLLILSAFLSAGVVAKIRSLTSIGSVL